MTSIKERLGLSATIVFEPDGRRFPTTTGISIFTVAIEAGIKLNTECGGRGTCGKCKIIVNDQRNLSHPREIERSHLTPEQLDQGCRLACQTTLLGDTTVYVPRAGVGQRRIQELGVESLTRIDPMVRKHLLKLHAPCLGEVIADVDQLVQTIKSQVSVEARSVRFSVVKSLPQVLRKAGWLVTATMWNQEVIGVEGGDRRDLCYGLAVDIGTSKLVVQLVELATGTTIGVESIENPQIVHGEDIYTRMSYALESDSNAEELARLVAQGVNTLLSDLCSKAGIDRRDIYEVVVVGNTAMHHFFLGLPTRNLALSPFIPVVSRGLNIDPSYVRFPINSEANVYVFPVIAGFVGGDAVADILSTGILQSEATSLLVDIGTNTEICLASKEDLICCSCASGPAFEGYHITHGIKAVSGAIERIHIRPETLKAIYTTVNGSKPVGICGSGMVDALAEMRRSQLVTKDGRFNPELRSQLTTWQGVPAFAIVQSAETVTGEVIVITQKDVRELQLAKAAVLTGCQALMQKKNVPSEDIEVVYVAGAFGNYLNIRNAIEIGMLPPIPEERFRMVGNAAIVGAKLGLVSSQMRNIAESIAKKTVYMELGARPTFNQEFTAALNFP